MKLITLLVFLFSFSNHTKEGIKYSKPFLYDNLIEIHKNYGPQKGYPVLGAKPYFYHGTIFKLKASSPIFSIYDGIIKKCASKKTGLGVQIEIEHLDGFIATYYHLKSFNVKEGQKVKSGEKIGISGSSGTMTTTGLGLKVNINGSFINPLKMIK